MLANIYLNDLDWELHKRGLRFVRYADDVVIFVKSEKAAERVMKSVISWIERKLFLKVNATKSKITSPDNTRYLGFTFLRRGKDKKWVPAVHKTAKTRLKDKIREITCRRKAQAAPIGEIFRRLNQTIKGWINYYSISPIMKEFSLKLGEWLRHRVRMVIFKQWKNRKTIFNNLRVIYRWLYREKDQLKLRKQIRSLEIAGITEEYIFAQCYTRCGWYRLSNNDVVNRILSPWWLERPIERKGLNRRPGLVNPLKHYMEMHDRCLMKSEA